LFDSSAQWVTRMHARELTRKDAGALRNWLSLSQNNRRAFLKTEVIWRLAGGLAADPRIRKEVRRLRRHLPRQARLQVVP
jgi:ferric-dicitrate binding protein FerR (iron transport regulator)